VFYYATSVHHNRDYSILRICSYARKQDISDNFYREGICTKFCRLYLLFVYRRSISNVMRRIQTVRLVPENIFVRGGTVYGWGEGACFLRTFSTVAVVGSPTVCCFSCRSPPPRVGLRLIMVVPTCTTAFFFVLFT